MKSLRLSVPGSVDFILKPGQVAELTTQKRNIIRGMMQAPAHRGGYSVSMPILEMDAGIDQAAAVNSFDSLQQKVAATKWDGKSRIHDYLIRHLGCADNTYIRESGALLLLGAVARAMCPGHKFDYTPVIEGKEGLSKSTYVETLALGFSSTAKQGDFDETRKILEKTKGSWIVELPELAVFTRWTAQQISAFISDKAERDRMAYDKFAETHHRRYVMIGTENRTAYLIKEDGNRKFWPWPAEKVDLPLAREEAPQLVAEAFVIFQEMRVAQITNLICTELANFERASDAGQVYMMRHINIPELPLIMENEGLQSLIAAFNEKVRDERANYAAARSLTEPGFEFGRDDEVLIELTDLPLFLQNPEAKKIALLLQKSRFVQKKDDSMLGMIEDWLTRPVGSEVDWTKGATQIIEINGKEVRVIRRFIAIQAWMEGLDRAREEFISSNASATISGLLGRVPFVFSDGSRARHPDFGQQRTYSIDPVKLKEYLEELAAEEGNRPA